MMVPVLLAVMVDPSEVQRRKKSVRRDVRARRDALAPTWRAEASVAIASRAVDRLPETGTIALYASMGSEADTAPLDALLRARGNTVVYPRVTEGARTLTFHPATTLAPSGRLQIREPLADATTVELAAIAAFVIPGIAFDVHGARVGWGRGHYDATLEGLDAIRIGIAFDCQIVPLGFDEAHDVHMHAVVTERMTYVRIVT